MAKNCQYYIHQKAPLCKKAFSWPSQPQQWSESYWPFLQWKDEIANPCNFSAQEEEEKKKLGRKVNWVSGPILRFSWVKALRVSCRSCSKWLVSNALWTNGEKIWAHFRSFLKFIRKNLSSTVQCIKFQFETSWWLPWTIVVYSFKLGDDDDGIWSCMRAISNFLCRFSDDYSTARHSSSFSSRVKSCNLSLSAAGAQRSSPLCYFSQSSKY